MAPFAKRPAAAALRTAAALALFALSAAFTGCAHSQPDDDLFETNGPSEVGATDFAVISVTRWNDIESELQPNFQLDEATALRLVMPVVGSGAESDTDSSRFALTATESPSPFNLGGGSGRGGGLGNRFGPGSKTSAVQSNAHASGARNSAGEKSGGGKSFQRNGSPSEETGAGPSAESESGEAIQSQNNAGHRNSPNGSPPGLANVQTRSIVQAGGSVSIEPQLQYTLATSLLQFVRMTNHYVHDMVDKERAHAYVVRMQITLMPLSREAPYDTFTDIAFFGADDKKGISPIQVVPLLATDSLEGIMQTNTASSSHDLALSLQALFGGGGAGFDAEKLSEKLSALSGEDKNSILTMGRVTDNTVRVRLGALAQPTGKYVMVPRTCTIPVVLLVSGETVGSPATVIHAVTKTIFVNSKTGKLLRGRAHAESLTHLPSIRDSYRLLDAKNPYAPHHEELIKLADAGDVPNFTKRVWELDQPEFSVKHPGAQMADDMASIGELWLEAVSLCSTDAVQMLKFTLPRMEESHLPPRDQTATLYDDGQKSQVLLHGGAALHQYAFQGILDVNPNAAAKAPQMRLYALDKPLFSADHQDLLFTFPSLSSASIGISGFVDPRNLVLTVISSKLEDETNPAKETGKKRVEETTHYNIVVLSANPEPPPPPPTVIEHLKLLAPVSAANGRPEIDRKNPLAKLRIAEGIPPNCHLVASGAEIAKLTPEEIVVKDQKGWAIRKAGEIDMTLTNLTQPQVEFYLEDASGNRMTAEPVVTIDVPKVSGPPSGNSSSPQRKKPASEK